MQVLRLSALLLFAASLLISCGGGGMQGGDPIADQQTSLTGTLTVDSDVKTSSALTALSSDVSVITAEGDLQAVTSTDSSGNFSFPSLSEGDKLLRFEFDSDHQLGQDGTHNVDLLVPVTVVGGTVNTIDAEISFQDLDNDGSPDGLLLDTDVNSRPDLRLIEPVDGFVRIDRDGDGDCMDEDRLRDLDGDGLPEDAHGSDNSLHGGILKGPIEKITDEFVVVNGVRFNITDATGFKDRGNRSPDMEIFSEGTNVHIRGMWNGEEWSAIELKTTGVRDKGRNDDDDDSDEDDHGDDDD